MHKITGNEPIATCTLRQTGEGSSRLAIPRDLQDRSLLMSNIGLTKREYFATIAMQGILANNQTTLYKVFGYSPENVARCSRQYADALITELNKTT